MEHAVGQNWFATFALLGWPLVGCVLYRTLSTSQAAIWIVLGAHLLLPAQAAVKLAGGIPQLDKTSSTTVALVVGFLLFGRSRLESSVQFGFADLLWWIFLLSPCVTSLLNDDPVAGSILLPPLGIYDGLSAVVAQFLFASPFVIGRRLLRKAEDVESLLRALVIAALVYSLPILFEIRMSPQLHRWIYGFYPFQFDELMRDGGYRPAVFLGHGLTVSFFIMTAVVASAAFWRAQLGIFNFKNSIITLYLGAVLVLCKSLGALIHGSYASLLVLLSGPRLHVRIAIMLGVLAVSYPLLRSLDLVPTAQIVSWASTINKDRAASLQTRFDNETQLLQRAMTRPAFGWGRWGRGRIFDQYGNDISITDGRWIITLGQYGIVGFLAEFGLLFLCVLRAASAIRLESSRPAQILFGALALIVAINTFDLLPNASLTSWSWLVAGTLLGASERLRQSEKLPSRDSKLLKPHPS